jgi:demethylmenaquinone methyltransferase/2-methoxy-6-polyprenyl-1,4-benzoquinol methylase/phosphoethanolamine N-methyltransferase
MLPEHYKGGFFGLSLHKHAPQDNDAPATSGITINSARMYEMGRSLLFGLDTRLWRMVLELAQVGPGQKVLDVGCGTGALAIAAVTVVGPAGEVCGIDAAPEMIQVSRRKASRTGSRIDFQVAVIEQLPFPDGHFDLVMNTLVMHHLPDEVKRKGLGEVYRVLGPGGHFVAVDLQLPKTPFAKVVGHLFLGHHMAENDISDSIDPLREAGFQDVETGPTRYSWFAFARGTK